MKYIESRNNPTVKNTVLLKDRRARKESGRFIFEGVHLLEEYLRFGHKPAMLFVRKDALSRHEGLIASADCETVVVSESVYEKLTEEKAPQGILTVSDFLDNVVFCSSECEELAETEGNSLLLVDLQDNGNVGTVIRTAASLGCDPVLCGSCADIYSPKTIRATMGALFSSRVYICASPENAVKALQKGQKRVLATALTENAEVLGGFDVLPTDAFVIGNEGRGLSSELIALCDKTVIIPMSGKTESLNAASAASIILWEAKRGRL
ncbi:MAG: RNA methyltransferase [Clostridia bacterium]|nr:RNA methyltransferase [Clostridia bacterium]